MKREQNKPYHHGNLKSEFIERGLEYIDKYGVESLSMRKLAEEIGVSSAAPYAHFKNKDAFLDAIEEYITKSLTDVLKEKIESCADRERLLVELGKQYVFFFYENPLYYQFLFIRGKADISKNESFRLFEEVSVKTLSAKRKAGYSTKVVRSKTLAMWALVQGLVQIAMMEGALDKDNMDKEIEEIICSLEV